MFMWTHTYSALHVSRSLGVRLVLSPFFVLSRIGGVPPPPRRLKTKSEKVGVRGPPVHVQRHVREGNVRDPSLCRETDRRVVCWCLLEVLEAGNLQLFRTLLV